MILHVWTVFCRKAITDKSNNQVTLVEVIEGIKVSGLPPELPPDESGAFSFEATLVSLWVRSDVNTPESGKGRITLLAPDGELSGDDEGIALEIPLSDGQRHRTFVTLTALPLKGAGRYTFKIELEVGGQWQIVALVPYQLMIVGESSTTDDAPPPRKRKGTAAAPKASARRVRRKP